MLLLFSCEKKESSSFSPKETKKWHPIPFPKKDISIKEGILSIAKLYEDIYFSKCVIDIQDNRTNLRAHSNLILLLLDFESYNKLEDKNKKAKKIIEIKSKFDKNFPEKFFKYLNEIKDHPSNMFNLTGFIFLEYFLKPMWNIFKNNENSINQNILKDLEQKAKEIKIFRDYLLNYDEKNQNDFKNLKISKRVLMSEYETKMFENLADKEKLQKISKNSIIFLGKDSINLELSNSELDEFSPKKMMGFHFDPIRELLDQGIKWADSLVEEARRKLGETNRETVLETRIQLRDGNATNLPDDFKHFTSDYFYEKRDKNYIEIFNKISILIDQEIEKHKYYVPGRS